MIKKALLFCENNDNIPELAKFLEKSGWSIFSNGSTAEVLKENEISFKYEAAFDNSPRNIPDSTMLVQKILKTKISTSDLSFETSDSENNYFLVCINFDPLAASFEAIPHVGVGTPSLASYRATVIRNCTTNYSNVIILTDPEDYKEALIEIRTESVQQSFRMYLAGKALNLVSAYDSANATSILQSNPFSNHSFLKYLTLPYKKTMDLKHGANSYQKSAVYSLGNNSGAIQGFQQLQGTPIIHQTMVDCSFAWDQICTLYENLKTLSAVKSENCDGYAYTTQFTPLTGTVYTVIVKYKIIVGAALDTNIIDSFKKTLSYDLDSTQDSTMACSCVIDEEAASEIIRHNFRTLIAPSFTKGAREILAQKENLTLICATRPASSSISFSKLDGGLAIQTQNKKLFDSWFVPTKTRPNQKQCDEMAFGMSLAKSANSYSCFCIKNNSVVGNATSYTSRFKALGACYYEVLQSYEFYKQTDNIFADVLVCDSSIYLCDTIKDFVNHGLTAIIQTGGTEGDHELIQYCDEHNVTMVFTGITHINY